jgi:uncharacterized protein YggT (Ycf19 family)
MLSDLISLLAKLYSSLIFIQALSTFFPSLQEHPLMQKSHQITQPFLDQIRKRVPGQRDGFDFSPIIAIILIMIAAKFLAYLFS